MSVGEKNQGWQVAMTTLAFERSTGQERIMMARVRELASLAQRLSRNGGILWDEPGVRQKLGQFAAEATAIRYTGFGSSRASSRGSRRGRKAR